MNTFYIISIVIGVITICLYLLLLIPNKFIYMSRKYPRVKVIYVSPYVIDKGCKMKCFGNKLFKIQVPVWYGYKTVETYNEGEHYQLMSACVKYNIIF